MLKIPTDTIVPVLKHALGEYKYLSPNVYKIKNGYKMFYCNRKGKSSLFALMYRYITGKQILYGEINRATSTNLKKWKKESQPIISPKNYKNYVSFLSPFFYKSKKNKYFLFVEAQKAEGSDVLCFVSNNTKDWSLYPKFKLSNNKELFQTPFILEVNNKIYFYYGHNRRKIICLILNDNLEIIKSKMCLKENFSNETYSVYSPSIIKIKDHYFMLYAAWTNTSVGNVNIAISKDGFKWKKIQKNLFKITEPFKIVSEPFIVDKRNKFFIFFEYKEKDIWNISYKCIYKKDLYKTRI